MAVQVFAYELWLATRPGAPAPRRAKCRWRPPRRWRACTSISSDVLEEIDFRDRTGGGHLMARIRRLFNRARLDQNEMNILRGILTAVQARRRPARQARHEATRDCRDSNPLILPAVNTATTIYLDYAATTPVDPRVAEAMIECLRPSGAHGNPSSAGHEFGRRARGTGGEGEAAGRCGDRRAARMHRLDFGRDRVRQPRDLRRRALPRRSRPSLVSRRSTEHKAVLDALKQLEREGFEVTWLKPGTDGIVRPEQVREALRPDTQLVSLMHVNNEIGRDSGRRAPSARFVASAASRSTSTRRRAPASCR